MPSSRQARIIRSAISPRFAMRILENIRGKRRSDKRRSDGGSETERSLSFPSSLRRSVAPSLLVRLRLLYEEQRLSELDRLPVLDQDLGDRPLHLRLDVVEDFHGLDDADIGVLIDGGSDRHERLCIGTRRGVEGA